jgi:hypothetical protein
MHCERSVQSGDKAPPQARSREEFLNECQTRAEQLIGVLSAESEALKRFDSELLLKLISHKEYSISVLCDSIHAFKRCSSTGEEDADSRSLLTLKEMFAEIKRLNDANRVYIETSLSHYQSFLTTILPTVYDQNEGYPAHPIVDFRGVAIKRKA